MDGTTRQYLERGVIDIRVPSVKCRRVVLGGSRIETWYMSQTPSFTKGSLPLGRRFRSVELPKSIFFRFKTPSVNRD